ncbi:MAG: helix-turn-helix domain-containing protein [Terricaulis sp.]
MLSITLAIGAANGFALALLLAFTAGNRRANLVLAALIAILALRLGPYILGFAGAYDAHRWLTFLPFDFSFAYGPLLWTYVRLLTTGQAPGQWRWHFAPVALQTCYWLICFALPLDAKWAWYVGGHLQVVAPIGAALGLASVALYLYAAYRDADRYRIWLDSAFANRDDARLWALRLLLLALAVTLVIATGFAITTWFITPLDYFDRFPLMVVFGVLTYALGLLGWRNASIVYLHPATALAPDAVHEPSGEAPNAYAAQGEAWRTLLIASGWWRDEALDLALLAEKLGTSPRTLSRTLSEGLGQNFRELVGRIRVDAVAEALEDVGNDAPILTLAMDAGFNSKASFNRAFQSYRGVTPSAYRERAAKMGLKNRQSPPKAGFEAT